MANLSETGQYAKKRAAVNAACFMIWFIKAYRLLIAPFLPGGCRFYPTCSRYAIEALQRYGLFKGMFFAIRRISRCHPWHPGGYDPVP